MSSNVRITAAVLVSICVVAFTPLIAQDSDFETLMEDEEEYRRTARELCYFTGNKGDRLAL